MCATFPDERHASAVAEKLSGCVGMPASLVRDAERGVRVSQLLLSLVGSQLQHAHVVGRYRRPVLARLQGRLCMCAGGPL